MANVSSPNRKAPLERYRNFGIAAHIDGGKTTLSERILFYTGMIHKLGETHDGSATTDWMEQEQERGITITSAAVTTNWKQLPAEGCYKIFENDNFQLNVIDTPGHVDFTAEVERSLRVLDGAIVVFCGVAGVQPQTQTVWRQASKYNVPRLCFVNKMDRIGANFDNVLADIRTKLGANASPVLIPIGSEDALAGQIDVVNQKAIMYNSSDKLGSTIEVVDIPAELKEEAEMALEELKSRVADVDDELAELFLMEEPIDAQTLKAAIRRATIANKFVPVAGGSAFKNKGVQGLLDAVVDYLPSPLEAKQATVTSTIANGLDENGYETFEVKEINPSDDDKPVALAFKLWADKFVGSLVFIRVYTGVIRKGDTVYNPRTRKRERVGRLLQIQANVHTDVDAVYSGDIAAIVGLKNATTGDTLASDDFDYTLEPPTFPDTVISMAVEPLTKGDQEKMSNALQRLSAEDPTFRVKTDEETGQTIIAGMGELHLEIIVDRLLREFKVEANVGKPQVAYKETIQKNAETDTRYARQSGGRGQFAHVKLRLEPNESGKGFEFVDNIVGGAIPKEFIPAVSAGIQGAMQSGVLAGFPVVDIKAVLYDGSFHEVDSSEMAFKIAGSMAFKEAMRKADPVLMEPIMKVDVIVPDQYMGDVIGDLNSRRGQVQGMEAINGAQRIHAFVPLSEMFGYATDLRSNTQGRGQYSMEPSHYVALPKSLAEKLVAAAGRKEG